MTSVSKDPSSNDISNEESGWTTYFEDFFNNNNIDDNNQHKSSLSLSRVASSSSLLSDATSLVEKKVAGIVEYGEEDVSVNKNGRESASFKKRKNIIDDALEDTATSPLNSPKVLYAKEQPEVETFSQEKGNTSGQKELSFIGRDSDSTELKELSFIGRDSDSTELKERGLCVVPMSMVVANHMV